MFYNRFVPIRIRDIKAYNQMFLDEGEVFQILFMPEPEKYEVKKMILEDKVANFVGLFVTNERSHTFETKTNKFYMATSLPVFKEKKLYSLYGGQKYLCSQDLLKENCKKFIIIDELSLYNLFDTSEAYTAMTHLSCTSKEYQNKLKESGFDALPQ